MKIGLPITQENWGTGRNSKWLLGNKIIIIYSNTEKQRSCILSHYNVHSLDPVISLLVMCAEEITTGKNVF